MGTRGQDRGRGDGYAASQQPPPVLHPPTASAAQTAGGSAIVGQDSAPVPGSSDWANEDEDGKMVFLQDFQGNLVSGFYQYGLIDWDQFHSCLHLIICTSTLPWAVFKFDQNAANKQGSLCPPSPDVPAPGHYIILSPSGDPITVNLIKQRARPRHPTISTAEIRREHYRNCVRQRDSFCLLSGRKVVNHRYSRFAAAHIFPRAHVAEWNAKGYPRLITDPAPYVQVGGDSKIDSLQNVMLVCRDYHFAWDHYELAVNPDRGHIIVPFVGGFDDIAGRTLDLQHITDPSIRPLDELFRDHFFQAVLKNMKGAGEPSWDYEDALGGGRMDLSRLDLWGGEEGREHLEFEMAHRFHSLVVTQELEGTA